MRNPGSHAVPVVHGLAALLCAAAIGLATPQRAGAELPPFSLGLGLQSIYSPDLQDYLDATYVEDTEGGGFLLGPQVSLQFAIGDYVAITPAFAFLFNYVEELDAEDDHFNTLPLPRLAAKVFLPTETMAGRFYLGGEVNYGFPDTGRDGFEFDEDGAGWGAFLGFLIKGSGEVEIGYVSVPAKVVGASAVAAYSEEVDMGGFMLRGGWNF